MEAGVRRGDECELERVTVKRRRVDEDGRPIGTYHKNPIMDTSQYEVEYLDGEIGIMTANIIAENLLSQVDEEGHKQMFIDEIQDHRRNHDAVPISKGFYTRKNGTRTKVRTTKGWELYVLWKDGSGDWIALKDIKDSYPVQLAEYAVSNKLNEEPAFAWWVPFVYKKRDMIIKKVKSKY